MIKSSNAMRFLMDDVREFHEAMDVHCAAGPTTDPAPELVKLRAKLIIEESMETVAGMFDLGIHDGVKLAIREACDDVEKQDVKFDIEAVADGLADLIYVAVGAALSFGIPLERVWTEVQSANMRKVGGPVRSDGKRGKPPGWTPPDIHKAVFGYHVGNRVHYPAGLLYSNWGESCGHVESEKHGRYMIRFEHDNGLRGLYRFDELEPCE